MVTYQEKRGNAGLGETHQALSPGALERGLRITILIGITGEQDEVAAFDAARETLAEVELVVPTVATTAAGMSPRRRSAAPASRRACRPCRRARWPTA